MQRQSQVQSAKEKNINSKLDEIIKRLDILTHIFEEDIYPEESEFRISYVKKETKRDNRIRQRKGKLRVFKNFAELDRLIA
jgi:hypothetical protein